MKKIMLIVLAVIALLLCGCGKERPTEAKLHTNSNGEFIEVVLPPRQKLISAHQYNGVRPILLYRPFRAEEKAEEYFFVGIDWMQHYKIKEQE